MHVEFAVEHRERGGVHMHVLAARCDLETGKSLNIAPPGWRKTLGRLRDGFNHEHGRSRPDPRQLGQFAGFARGSDEEIFENRVDAGRIDGSLGRGH